MLFESSMLARATQRAVSVASTSRAALNSAATQRTRLQHTSSSSDASEYDARTGFDNDLMELLQSVESSSLPPLQALDDLDLTSRGNRRSVRAHHAMRNVQAWREALGIVKGSFSIVQLRGLVKDAEVPRSVLSQQQKNFRTLNQTKDVLASALLVHRFGFEDPRKSARENEARTMQTEVVKTMSTSHLYLLFTVRMEEFRSLLQRNRVKFTSPDRPAGFSSSTEHVVKLTGAAEAVTEVQEWLDAFVADVISSTETLAAVTSMPATLPPPSAEQLQHVSGLTGSNIVSESKRDSNSTIKITSVDSLSWQSARNLLTQLQHEKQCSRNRSYISLTAPSIPSHQDAALPQYSLQLHCSAEDGPIFTSNRAYRLTRQGLAIRDIDALDWESWGRGTEQIMATGNLPYVQRIESDKAINGSNVVQSLVNAMETNVGEDACLRRIMTADFGHLLFRPDDSANSLYDMLSAPLKGSWPVDYGLSWLREDILSAQQKETLPNRAPIFVPSVPSSATSAITHNSSGEMRENRTGGSKNSDSDMQGVPADLVDIFASLNVPSKRTARTTFLGLLEDDIAFKENFCVRYVRGGQTLAISLTQERIVNEQDASEQEVASEEVAAASEDQITSKQSSNEEELPNAEEESIEDEFSAAENEAKPSATIEQSSAWKVKSISISSSNQVDVLVPDASSDVRLSSSSIEGINVDALNDEDWNSFLSSMAEHSPQTLRSTRETTLPQPPSTLKLAQDTFSFLDCNVQDQWTWELVNADADAGFEKHHPTVVQTNSICLQTSRASTTLQARWDRDVSGEHATTLWHCIRRVLGPALAEPYESGRGHST